MILASSSHRSLQCCCCCCTVSRDELVSKQKQINIRNWRILWSVDIKTVFVVVTWEQAKKGGKSVGQYRTEILKINIWTTLTRLWINTMWWFWFSELKIKTFITQQQLELLTREMLKDQPGKTFQRKLRTVFLLYISFYQSLMMVSNPSSEPPSTQTK